VGEVQRSKGYLSRDGIAMTAPTLTERLAPLTLADRCDRCGAQAYFRALFVSGELTFCGHHGRELMDSLLSDAILVEDGTETIPH
jgi:hypothetical protein